MGLAIRQMNPGEEAKWDKFVFEHPDGTFCHRAGWKHVIEQGARQSASFLFAEDCGKLVGILPLSHRKSYLFGDAMISTMFAVYGGPLALSEAAYSALDAAAWEYASEHGSGSLEFRSIKSRTRANKDWVCHGDNAVTFRGALQTDKESALLSIPRKQRAVVRKSLKAGLTCSWDHDIDRFYSLYAESVRNLGTPVFPKQMFRAFLDIFGDDVEIQVIYTPDGQAIASLMSFYHGEYVLPYYAGGKALARKYGAHDFMYFKLMLRAIERGKTKFDFGRSKVDTGPYRFKKNWGFTPTPLEYEIRLAEGAVASNFSPTNHKFELMVKVWKKLPLPVANILGPLIARHLG